MAGTSEVQALQQLGIINIANRDPTDENNADAFKLAKIKILTRVMLEHARFVRNSEGAQAARLSIGDLKIHFKGTNTLAEECCDRVEKELDKEEEIPLLIYDRYVDRMRREDGWMQVRSGFLVAVSFGFFVAYNNFIESNDMKKAISYAGMATGLASTVSLASTAHALHCTRHKAEVARQVLHKFLDLKKPSMSFTFFSLLADTRSFFARLFSKVRHVICRSEDSSVIDKKEEIKWNDNLSFPRAGSQLARHLTGLFGTIVLALALNVMWVVLLAKPGIINSDTGL